MAQQVLLAVGVMALVAAAALVVAAAWTYRVLDIRGVRADLSGVARAREIDEARASGRRTAVSRTRSLLGEGSEAADTEGAGGEKDAPLAQAPGQPGTTSPAPAAGPRADEPAPGSGAGADAETAALGAFAFCVTRRELGVGTLRRIEG